ncbi:MAG: 3-phosphoshikimate 1-carboxyvinyltransferase [Methylophilaceae bacterium]
MQKKLLKATNSANGSIELPGSKSITNRIFLMAALSNEQTLIKDYLDSDDTKQMLTALKLLGVNYQIINKKDILMDGVGLKFPNQTADLFLGNAGTAFRPLTAVLSLMGGNYRLRGIPRMHERPIKDLVDALQQMGANIQYEEKIGYPPIKITNSKITFNQSVSIKGNVSSQYLTALLIAGPISNHNLCINIEGDLISKPYIDISLKLLEKFGVHYDNHNWEAFKLHQPALFKSPGEIFIEGDASSASYFFAAGAISGTIEVKGINQSSIQGDLKFLDIISLMGANVEYFENSVRVSNTQNMKGMIIDCKEIPDAAMTLAVMAMFAHGETKLTNIESWRVKETDRIVAMQTELEKLGAKVISTKDSITISPPIEIKNNVEIETYNDHRIAMCFSLIALANKNITILDPGCVNKTYPNYFKDFESVIS